MHFYVSSPYANHAIYGREAVPSFKKPETATIRELLNVYGTKLMYQGPGGGMYMIGGIPQRYDQNWNP